MQESIAVTNRAKPILVTMIGDFPGAGKTTLLNHILGENQCLRAAMLVNDFGVINSADASDSRIDAMINKLLKEK